LTSFNALGEDAVGAVEGAIGSRYRLVDTAAACLKEREVGEGTRKSGMGRDEVFIETRIRGQRLPDHMPVFSGWRRRRSGEILPGWRVAGSRASLLHVAVAPRDRPAKG
jgi:hypothetical protein